MTKFHTKTGDLTPYALACGYCEIFESKSVALTLWQEGGTRFYQVRAHDKVAGGHMFWSDCSKLSEAIRVFKDSVAMMACE